MSLDVASLSIVAMLRREHALRSGEPRADFRLVSADAIQAGLDEAVTLFLYRVDIDPSQRRVEVDTVGPSHEVSRRTTLAVEARYLLTAWFRDPVVQQRILARCMSILDARPTLSQDDLTAPIPWMDDDVIKIGFDTIDTEQLQRQFESLTVPYQPSVPLIVRRIRLEPLAREPVPMVKARENQYHVDVSP